MTIPEFTEIGNSGDQLDHIIETEEGITGIKIGPEGNIWYTNRLTNKVMMVTPGEPVNVYNLEEIFPISVAPNPTSGMININLSGNSEGDLNYRLMSATGQKIRDGLFINTVEELDLSGLQSGLYFITIFNETHATTKKVVMNK